MNRSRVWFTLLIIGIAGITLSTILVVWLKKASKTQDRQGPDLNAKFNPDDIEETARWVDRVGVEEMQALGDVDPNNPVAVKLFCDRMEAHLSKYSGQSVRWKLDVVTTHDYRGTARAWLQRKFPNFTVNAPDLVARENPVMEGNDDLGQYIPMPATEFLKLKPGTVVLVSGNIWFATAYSIHLRDCSAAIVNGG
jgi:hypothetical protein